MLNLVPESPISWVMVELMDWSAPEPAMTAHSTATMITSMIPKAMENRNVVFITDQGSMREMRSLALRVRRTSPTFESLPSGLCDLSLAVLDAPAAGAADQGAALADAAAAVPADPAAAPAPCDAGFPVREPGRAALAWCGIGRGVLWAGLPSCSAPAPASGRAWGAPLGPAGFLPPCRAFPPILLTCLVFWPGTASS